MKTGAFGLRFAALAAFGIWPFLGLAAEEPSQDELWRIIQKQQQQIERQQKQIDALAKRLDDADEKIDLTGEMVETVAAEGGGAPGWWDHTQVGGYGELHYEGGDKDEIDFHRFILFVGHDFNEDIRLFSEVEIEHALVEDTADGSGAGEVVLEQAFLQFDVGEEARINTGAFLVPIGMLNEKHEPPTFFGVEHNVIETETVPTTWTEAGIAAQGLLGAGFSGDFAVTSGLATPVAGANAFRIRSGRQKVAEAPFEDPMLTGRLKWTGLPGLELAATGIYHTDITQSQTNNSAWTAVAHADILHDGFGFRAFGGGTVIDGNEPEAFLRDEQWGFYLEPSYRFFLSDWLGPEHDWGEFGVFTRYSRFNTRAGDSQNTGLGSDVREEIEIGFNYWPHAHVVFKLDFQFEDQRAGNAEDDWLNLGLGFEF